MQDDVTDGVRALIAQGIADPKRVCIVGCELRRLCGAGRRRVHAGVLCLRRQHCGRLRSARDVWRGTKRWPAMNPIRSHYWRDSHRRLDWIRRSSQKSPARSADTIRAPILLHAWDQRHRWCRSRNREMMANALKAAGRPYQFIALPRRGSLAVDQQCDAHPHVVGAREVPGRKPGRRRQMRQPVPQRAELAELVSALRAAPCMLATPSTGATGFDVGSEP